MKVEILGCSGGALSVKGTIHHTTAYLINETLLIDAGTGALTLTSSAICRLTDVFISHSHLDHVLALPLLIDSLMLCFRQHSSPIKIHALPETIQAIQQHIFNDVIYPDFTQLPSPDNPLIVFEIIEPKVPINIHNVTVIPYRVEHVVPTVGYLIEEKGKSIFFSGDTITTNAIQEVLTTYPNLEHLIVEMTFPDELEKLSVNSKHFCPSLLVENIDQLKLEENQQFPVLWTTHAKPGAENRLAKELAFYADHVPQFGRFKPRMLQQGMILNLNDE